MRVALAALFVLLVGGRAEAGVQSAPPSPAPESPTEEADTCLGCHGDPDLSLSLPDGAKVSLTVKPDDLAHSVHGGSLRCTDCHTGMGEVPHPERPYRSLAEFRAGFREVCKSCHFENYTKLIDGVHYSLLPKGSPHAPSCIDCHGSHAVARAGQPRSTISRTCARCHSEISDTYASSVHGRALLESNNPDVPVCTDCHRSHDIADPRQQEWLLQTPELCGKCHTDPKRMNKYGLSTAVVQTYLADFHGTTAAFAKGHAPAGQGRLTAVCTDCHGVHDIKRVRDPDSRVVKHNLVKTCQRCHPGATESFPAAWLSHYEPGWKKAPLVYAVKAFYAVFIPFIVGGLALQVLLHFWRVVVNR